MGTWWTGGIVKGAKDRNERFARANQVMDALNGSSDITSQAMKQTAAGVNLPWYQRLFEFRETSEVLRDDANFYNHIKISDGTKISVL